MANLVLPALFLCFAATVLLVFVSVSVPTWNAISLLNVNPQLRYGVFGYTNSKVAIGYDFTLDELNTVVIHNLTKILIFHPIAAGFAGFAFLSGLSGAMGHRFGTVFMSIFSLIALILTLIIWIVDMSIFGIARNKYRDTGANAVYGNAVWLTLGALVALFLGCCTSACAIFGRYSKRRH